MATLQHVYARPADKDQFVLILADSFPSKSLLFGSNARIFCELIYEPKAVKTGGGFGQVIIDEFGVPAIVGPAGEYTFSWYVNDKTDSTKYGPYTCVMTTTAFADVTSPVVAITTTGGQTDLRPALVGTVDDATARVVVTINNKDYVAANDSVGGWSIPINTIDVISIDVTTVTVRAIDNSDNVGTASTTIYYDGSEYALVHDFDVAAAAIANSWVDAQEISSLPSTVGPSSLAGATATTKPSYDSANNGLLFTFSPADRLYNNNLEPFREIFMVLHLGTGTLAPLFQMRSATGTEVPFYLGSSSTQWRFNNVNVSGRIPDAKQVVHLRYLNGSVKISTNGGAEQTATASVSDIDLKKLYIHDVNFGGATMRLHEIATTGKLNANQRAAVIADLKTKWGIA